ncbi:MAG: DUF6206 family protein [Promethearchaeota archaeon]
MKINIELLKELERTIDTIHPEKGKIPINVLGYGEISLVFEFIDDPENLAYKRIPIFDNERQVKRHIWAYNAYNKILKDRLGFNLPEYDVAWFKDNDGKIQFYCVQRKINTNSVGNNVIHHITNEEIKILILLVMKELKKVWDFNRKNKKIDVGLDGQISNFAVIDFDINNPKIEENSKLLYLDTSTPMFRINGKEAMDAVLFLKSAPFLLRGILKALFLQDTVDRYYDWRRVTIDLLANFIKEQKAEVIPELTRVVNKFFKEDANEFNIKPITLSEIQSYYKSDAQMWEIFQKVRKFDRWLKTKIFRKKYDFYLPGKIKRY